MYAAAAVFLFLLLQKSVFAEILSGAWRCLFYVSLFVFFAVDDYPRTLSELERHQSILRPVSSEESHSLTGISLQIILHQLCEQTLQSVGTEFLEKLDKILLFKVNPT